MEKERDLLKSTYTKYVLNIDLQRVDIHWCHLEKKPGLVITKSF